MAAAGSEAAAVVKILAAGSALHGARSAIAEFMQRSPGRIELATDHGHLIHERVRAGACDADIAIIPADLMQDLDGRGQLQPGSASAIGAVGIGYAVPPGFEPPAMGGAEDLTQAATAAEKIFLTTAPTGLHMRACLERLGLGEMLAGKLVTFDTASAMNRQLAEERFHALAFGPATELIAGRRLGLVWGGAVPEAVDLPLPYAAGVLARSAHGAEARAVLDFLAGPAGRAHFAASGVI